MKDLIFLDLTWGFLVASSLSSSLVLLVGLVAHRSMKPFFSQDTSKRFFNVLIGVLLSILFLGAVVLILFDPAVVEGCFARWSMKSSSYQGTRVLAGSYVIALSLLVGWDLRRYLKTQRRISGLPIVTSPAVLATLRKISESSQAEIPLKVVIDPLSKSPYVWGAFRHTLVLTRDFMNLREDSAARCVLAHELMHIKGRDALGLIGAHLFKRIMFFHPLSYFLASRHRLATEMAADENAVRALRLGPAEFAEALIRLGSRSSDKAPVFSMAASSGYLQTKARIQALFAEPIQSSPWVFRGSVIGLIALASMVFSYQAEATFERRGQRASNEELMCLQVQHEKIIEGLLSAKPAKNQCDLN